MIGDISPIDLLPLIEDINPTGYAVLSYFVFSSDQEVWISYKRLEEKTTLHVRTIIKVVSRLEELGILSVQRFPQGSGEVNRYRVNMKHLQSLIEESKAKRKQKKVTRGGTVQSSSFSTPPGSPSVPLSECLSDPAEPPAIPSGFPNSGEPAEPQIDPQYLILAQRIHDGSIRPDLLEWLKDIKMVSSSGELDLRRLTMTFSTFQDFCSGFEQRVSEDKEVDGKTRSIVDGLNLVEPAPKELDPTTDIINSLGKHFGLKGV